MFCLRSRLSFLAGTKMSTLLEAEDLTLARQERLAFIDFNLMFKGEATREFLTSRFGIAASVATKDFARYKTLAPQNILYDRNKRIHLRSKNFKPLFDYDIEKTLTILSEGFGDNVAGKKNLPIHCETHYRLRRPDLNILANITEAIYRKRAIKATYISLYTGKSEREIVPHTLVDGGLRWHVRAYDRNHNDFRDFVLTRFETAEISSKDDVQDGVETIEKDTMWNRMLLLDLIVHPNITFKEAIERDYGMTDGHLLLDVRAALATYLLRIWNVDCTEDHSIQDPQYYLALNNTEILKYFNKNFI